jgi:hypothetical protein
MNKQTSDFLNVGVGKRVKARWWKPSLTKWQIKVYLTIVGLFIVAGVLYYTQIIVGQLIEGERKTVQFYADILQNFTQSNNIESLFLIERVTPTITFPCILTDSENLPLEPYNQYSLNVPIDSTKTKAQQREYLQRIITDMAYEYKPITVKDQGGMVLSKIYFTNSVLVKRLRVLPYIEIIIVGVFIGIGYIAFSYLKRNEESNIWVGMAKEAAHQLGTPLSSMLAWIEILRISRHEEEEFSATLGEMEQDIERLKTIANRFSLIGSEPKMRQEHLASTIENVCVYFERRFPHLGKQITLARNFDESLYADINSELFSWVFENLLKNAAEAIEVKEGKILIEMIPPLKPKTVAIQVSDNGKGMTMQVRNQIFNPGYTTKKRGWGLGLSLSKRIIEEYHQGRLLVKQSTPGVGTTFLIEIPVTRQQ